MLATVAASISISHTEYLNYMYGSAKGLITRSVIPADKNAYYEAFSFSDRLIYRNRYFGVENVYTSMNTFLTRYNKNDSNSGRKVSNLKRLNALYLDLDCYKIGLSQEAVLAELEKSYFGKTIPVPTFVINSGRGLYLIWKINEDRNALPRWTSVQHYLFECCKHFNADPKALDAARILRVPGSVHSATGNTVSVVRFNDVKYTLYEIIKKYNIKPKQYKKKPDRGVIYPFGEATERQRYVAKRQASELGVELPNFSDFTATFHFIRANQAEFRRRLKEQKKENVAIGTMNEILEGRVQDLFKLFSMRRGEDCCREYALFLCRLWVGELTGNYEYALKKTLELNRSFDVPFGESYVLTRTKSAETKLIQGTTYQYRLNTIISALEITDFEQQQLSYLKKDLDEQKAKKKGYNRKSYLSRLEKRGAVTKSETVTCRRQAIKGMLSEGKSKTEICTALKISPRTFDRDKASILANKVIDAVQNVISKSTEMLKTAKEHIQEKLELVKLTPSPIIKHPNYRRTPIGCSAYSYTLDNNIICAATQLTWNDVVKGGLFNDTQNSLSKQENSS